MVRGCALSRAVRVTARVATQHSSVLKADLHTSAAGAIFQTLPGLVPTPHTKAVGQPWVDSRASSTFVELGPQAPVVCHRRSEPDVQGFDGFDAAISRLDGGLGRSAPPPQALVVRHSHSEFDADRHPFGMPHSRESPVGLMAPPSALVVGHVSMKHSGPCGSVMPPTTVVGETSGDREFSAPVDYWRKYESNMCVYR